MWSFDPFQVFINFIHIAALPLCVLVGILDWPGAIDKAELRRLLWDTGYSVNRLVHDMLQGRSTNEDVAMIAVKKYATMAMILETSF